MNARSLLLAAVIFTLLPSATIHAQQADTVILEGVVISATKAPASAGTLPQSVTVITGAELRARGITSVAEALRLVPSLAVASTGSYGALASVFVRGGESRYTKFLVDGVPVNAVGGLFDAAHLSTANVERIEVVRGAASVVHGADAVSGVVQIFTRKGSGPVRVSSELRGGSYATVEAAAGITGSVARTGLTMHGARNSTDGILPFNNEYRNETVSASLDLARSARAHLSIAARGTHAVVQYPTDFMGNVVDSNSYRDQARRTLSLDAARKVGHRLQLRLLAGMNDATDFTDDVTTSTSGDTRDRYTSHNLRQRVEARAVTFVPSGTVTTGAEYQRERERSHSAAGPPDGALVPYSRFGGSRITRAAYAEYLASVRRLSLNASARLDDPSDFDPATTFRFGSAVRLAPGLKARGSVSTSYNAPAFFYLFDTDFTSGNADLDPERARTFEASVEQNLAGAVSLSATYFDQKFNDLIEYVPGGPPDFVGTYANLSAARSKGYEVEALTSPWRGWSANASFTVLRAVVRAVSPDYQGGARVGDELLRRPRRSGTAGAHFSAASGVSLSVNARHVGKRPDLDFRTFPSARITLPAFTTMDAAASIPVLAKNDRPRVALTVRVENVFDKRYQEVFNFDAPGRRVMVGGRLETRLR